MVMGGRDRVCQVDFLELFGRTLNMREVGVSCRGGGHYFSKREHRYPRGCRRAQGADRQCDAGHGWWAPLQALNDG